MSPIPAYFPVVLCVADLLGLAPLLQNESIVVSGHDGERRTSRRLRLLRHSGRAFRVSVRFRVKIADTAAAHATRL